MVTTRSNTPPDTFEKPRTDSVEGTFRPRQQSEPIPSTRPIISPTNAGEVVQQSQPPQIQQQPQGMNVVAPQPIYPNQVVMPSGANQGVMPPGVNQGAMPPGANQGVMPTGANQGVMPPGVNQGAMPPGATQGVMPPGANQGVMPPVANQGVLPPGTNQGVYPPGTVITPQGLVQLPQGITSAPAQTEQSTVWVHGGAQTHFIPPQGGVAKQQPPQNLVTQGNAMMSQPVTPAPSQASTPALSQPVTPSMTPVVTTMPQQPMVVVTTMSQPPIAGQNG